MDDDLCFDELPIVPAPARGELLPGELTLGACTSIDASRALADLKNSLQVKIASLDGSEGGGSTIRLILMDDVENCLSREVYRLSIIGSEIQVTGFTRAGVFYGVQTLLQLMDGFFIPGTYDDASECIVLPCMHIEDEPRFEWRGMMLDVSRHFFHVHEIKAFLDQLAHLKFNVFHWHLTDDQGWRIEIKSLPKLSAIGSIRSASPQFGDANISDFKPYGPFYFSQDEIRDVLEYARLRNIQVVPEIDLPGHVMAALACYPDLGCSKGPYEVRTTWGVEDHMLCLGNPAALDFVYDVLGEVAALFPSPFLHIGGDETSESRWAQCPLCQAAALEAGVIPGSGLKKMFLKQVEAYLTSLGKRAIVWDEILDDDPVSTTVIASWRGMERGIAAAAKGNDVIMCPCSHCYLDYRWRSDPPQILGAPYAPILSLETCYNFEPAESSLDAHQAVHILGIQGNIWTEYMWSAADLAEMAFPRAHALAEVAWSPREKRDFKSFENRLQVVMGGRKPTMERKNLKYSVDLVQKL